MKLDVYMASFNQRTLDSDETVSVELFINILGSISWKISNNVDDLRLWFFFENRLWWQCSFSSNVLSNFDKDDFQSSTPERKKYPTTQRMWMKTKHSEYSLILFHVSTM